jgi:putative spermidine/putrescine transport system ATP-binding protein
VSNPVTPSHVPGAGVGVRLESLRRVYGQVTAVDDVDLTIRPGEFLTLLGPSGSGKTTTLAMVAGFTQPTDGRVLVGDRDITRLPPHRRNMGMVFQNYSLFPHLNVQQNVEFPLRQRRVPRTDRARRAREALEVVELGARADAMPNELSGGQQQRVALARALVFEPSVLLMDEPFGALDRGLRERMQLEVRRIHRELGVTVLFVTHDQQEALTMSDRIAVFNHGRIEQLGPPEEPYERPASRFVATFLGESNIVHGTARGEILDTADGSCVPLPRTLVGPAVLIVRPEQIRLGGDPGDGGPRVEATVRDLTYLGADRRVELDAPFGEMIVRLPAGAAVPDLGERVVLSWDIASSSAFAEETLDSPVRDERSNEGVDR